MAEPSGLTDRDVVVTQLDRRVFLLEEDLRELQRQINRQRVARGTRWLSPDPDDSRNDRSRFPLEAGVRELQRRVGERPGPTWTPSFIGRRWFAALLIGWLCLMAAALLR